MAKDITSYFHVQNLIHFWVTPPKVRTTVCHGQRVTRHCAFENSYHHAVSGCNSFLQHNYYKSLWTCGAVYNPAPNWPEQRLGREAWRAQVLPGSCCSCCSCYSCSGCLGASWVVVASEAFCKLCTQLLGKYCKFTSTRLWTQQPLTFTGKLTKQEHTRKQNKKERIHMIRM